MELRHLRTNGKLLCLNIPKVIERELKLKLHQPCAVEVIGRAILIRFGADALIPVKLVRIKKDEIDEQAEAPQVDR